MAKIYETKEDYERDKLGEQTAGLHLKSSQQSQHGMAIIGTSLFLDVLNMSMRQARGWLSAVSTFLGVVGVIDMFKGWNTKNRAHDLELQRDRLGPQQVILPADVAEPQKEGDCLPCALKKKFGEATPQKTLAEYAQKPVDNGIKQI